MKYKFCFWGQILFLLAAFMASAKPLPPEKEVVLEDRFLTVAFDSQTGALIRMENKSTHWMIERSADRGVSFRLFVPMAGRQDNFILGRNQHAQVEKISDHELRIQWKNLISEHSGTLPIELTAKVSLQEGALTFNASLKNNSGLTVETVSYPFFDHLNAPDQEARMDVRTMWYGNLESDEIYPRFDNRKGYWGVFFPTKTFDSYRSLFCLIQSDHQGIYLAMKDPSQRYLMQYTFAEHPGTVQSVDNPVPKQDEIGGQQVHLDFRTCHFIYCHPHSATTLAPVVLQCYSGDWHSGVDIYKQWRGSWFKQPHVPDWIKNVNAWQQLQINSTAQDYRVRYTDLIEYGKQCAQNGVKAIQLVGWNLGGQDGGDPSLSTDPGLGTAQQLKDAISEIQRMGVKIILFGKLNWADKTTEWYKTELYKYAATDPYGIPYEQEGYSYYTPTQLADIDKHRRAVMDFMDPAYRDIATGEFKKLLSLGASGWLFDENCHHGPVKYSFAPGHGYRPPGFIYGGDMLLAAQMRAAADQLNPDFLFAGEGHQDWLMQYYSCSYFRINGGSVPVMRYIDPQAPLVVAVTGFDDREMLNLILMDRYIISYEPFFFKGRLSDFPLTLAYGKKIDSLRTRYKAYLWDGEFRDTQGAHVTADGAVRYSVFVTKTGKRAVVVVNPQSGKSINAKVTLSNPGKLLVATPEQPDANPTSGILKIPARSAAVVMEE